MSFQGPLWINKLKHEYVGMRLISVPNLHGNVLIHQFITWQILACSTSTSDFALLEHKHALGQTTLGISYCKHSLPNCFVLLVLQCIFFSFFFFPFFPKIKNILFPFVPIIKNNFFSICSKNN